MQKRYAVQGTLILLIILVSVFFFYKAVQEMNKRKDIPANALPPVSEPASKIVNGVVRQCIPDAYYTSHQHILNPSCSPEDPRCTVDPCR